MTDLKKFDVFLIDTVGIRVRAGRHK